MLWASCQERTAELFACSFLWFFFPFFWWSCRDLESKAPRTWMCKRCKNMLRLVSWHLNSPARAYVRRSRCTAAACWEVNCMLGTAEGWESRVAMAAVKKVRVPSLQMTSIFRGAKPAVVMVSGGKVSQSVNSRGGGTVQQHERQWEAEEELRTVHQNTHTAASGCLNKIRHMPHSLMPTHDKWSGRLITHAVLRRPHLNTSPYASLFLHLKLWELPLSRATFYLFLTHFVNYFHQSAPEINPDDDVTQSIWECTSCDKEFQMWSYKLRFIFDGVIEHEFFNSAERWGSVWFVLVPLCISYLGFKAL